MLRQKDKNKMLSDVGSGGLASVLDVQFFFFLLKKIGFPPFSHGNTSYWAKQYIVDKKSSFSFWHMTVKPSFNDTIALFVG